MQVFPFPPFSSFSVLPFLSSSSNHEALCDYEIKREFNHIDVSLENESNFIIIENKVKKALSESTLTAQSYLLDDSKNVGQVLKEKGASVTRFVRYFVGEGIEKRVDNFAEEVMKEIK